MYRSTLDVGDKETRVHCNRYIVIVNFGGGGPNEIIFFIVFIEYLSRQWNVRRIYIQSLYLIYC